MASPDPTDPQNTSEAWQVLRSAFGTARANGIIVFFVMAGAAWVVLSLLEKIGNVIKAFSEENVSGISASNANPGEMIIAVGVVLLFAVIFGWTMTRRENRRELDDIRSDIALIKKHLGITDGESVEADDGKVHTDD